MIFKIYILGVIAYCIGIALVVADCCYQFNLMPNPPRFQKKSIANKISIYLKTAIVALIPIFHWFVFLRCVFCFDEIVQDTFNETMKKGEINSHDGM